MAGFMKAFVGANNEWGKITCVDGIGGIGPENLVDNRNHMLMVTIGMETTVFGTADVASITLIAATSEWIKYLIKTKKGKEYVATFPVFTTGQNGKQFHSGLLNFEWWMAKHLYKNAPVAAMPSAPVTPAPSAPVTPAPTAPIAPAPIAPVAPVPSVPVQSAPAETKPSKPIKAAPLPTVPVEADVPAAAMPKYPAPPRLKKPPIAEETTASTGTAEENVEDGGLSQEEKSRLYGFALQMIGNRSYAAARNVLLKIRGYKNVDELLAQLDER